MPEAAYSTAASDAVLSATAYYAAYQLYLSNKWGSVAFLSVALAATAGVVRFSLNNPSAKVVTVHKMLAFMSSVLVGTFIVASYHISNPQNIFACVISALMMVIIVKCADAVLHRFGKEIATSIVSGLGIVGIVLWNIWLMNIYGIVGGMMYVIAGVVVGTDGDMGGIPCVDVFHYILALGNIILLWSLM